MLKRAEKPKASKIALRFPAKAAKTACFQFFVVPVGHDARILTHALGL
jgi:hypothetical protein